MRLIDADALPVSTEFSEDGEYSWDIVPAFRILSAPTIDAVPVVRCGECERRDKSADLTLDVFCPYMEAVMPKDAFCSYGERKEN